MKKRLLLGLCLSLFAFGCQQAQQPHHEMKRPAYKDDQNYQDRRREMKKRSSGGCCEAEQVPKEEKQTAETAEVKAEVKSEES